MINVQHKRSKMEQSYSLRETDVYASYPSGNSLSALLVATLKLEINIWSLLENQS